MPEQRESPLTGAIVDFRLDFDRDIHYYDDICGEWAVTLEAQWSGANIEGGRLRLAQRTLSVAETRKTMALAVSEVWRINAEGSSVPLFMNLSSVQSSLEAPLQNMRIVTLEDLFQATNELSLETKANRTLQNLVLAELEVGLGVEVPYYLENYPGEPLWRSGETTKEIGISYGCTPTEAPLVYQLLASKELIAIENPKAMGDNSRIYVTPKGYVVNERIMSGRGSDPCECFFVCRFIPELDMLYEEVVKPLGEEIGVRIQRVKDIHHIDKIDDRICQEIDGANFVLVDLSEQNFNVAFEAGYALARNKPIVWTMKHNPEGLQMPFDIYTYNCLSWNPDNLTDFKEVLRYRLLAAVEKARRVGSYGE